LSSAPFGAALAALLLLPLWCGAAEPASQGFQTIKVKPGDTLWSIANRYLMDPARWDEILRHNKLPSSDPTVALPGMSLRVPVRLIKEELRAAEIIYVLNRVDSRRRETAHWKSAKEADQVFEGDSVRTLETSKAKVRFLNADMLNIDADSLVIIKPPKADFDVELKRGGVFVGRSRVVTASARITPRTKDTEYSAKVRQDLSTLVEVYKGQATVDAQGQTVDVSAGMATEVKLGLAPALPTKIADLPEFEARAAEFSRSRVAGETRPRAVAEAKLSAPAVAAPTEGARDIGALNGDMQSLSIGMPVAGYRVQASRTRQFAQIVFDKTFDVDEKIDLKNALPSGVYWWRIAMIDLLGTEGSFSPPRLYALGVAAAKTGSGPQDSLVLLSPRQDESVGEQDYLVKGLVKDENAGVLVNERPVRLDEAGNFQMSVRLKEGDNRIVVRITDASGASAVLTRTLTYVPPRR
jgi:hypothetical protein